MPVVPKTESKLADRTNYPQLGEAQAVITNAVTGGSATASNAAGVINEILEVLRYHGLIKE